MKLNNKTFRITTITLAMLFGITGCNKAAPASEKAEEPETVFAVNAYKISPKTLDDYLEFGGSVQAASNVDVYPSTNGKVQRILVRVGDYVEKDQVLAEIDASRAGMDFKSSPVKAPVAGTVTSLPLNVGATVAASMSVGKIASTNQLEIYTNVAERFVSRVSLNQKAELKFDAFPGEKFPAVLVEVEPILDTSSRTLGIKLQQTPSDSRLKSGMYARIKLITQTINNAIIIPANVIVTRDEKSIVYVVKDNIVEAREVTPGLKIDDKQEISSGLNVGETIVIKGQALLSEGSKVKVISVSE